MFGKKVSRELPPPPIASIDQNSVEVLRVWVAPGQPYQLILKTTWNEPGVWGLLLVDVARHVAQAYEKNGLNRSEALQRIRQFLDAEFANPTDSPREIG